MQLALSLVIVAMSFGATQAPVRNSRWWLDASMQRELALTSAQVAALQAEYSRTLDRRRRLRRALDEASAELARALERGDLSDDAAAALISRVEDIRRQRNVARARLLVAMYFLLTPPQRTRLRIIRERTSVAASPPC